MTDTMTARESYTYWVCVDCFASHHGFNEAELGREYPTDPAPLTLIPTLGDDVAAGLTADEHADDCPVWHGTAVGDYLPLRDAECECETDTFSCSHCDGCGSPLAGERHALTLFTYRRFSLTTAEIAPGMLVELPGRDPVTRWPIVRTVDRIELSSYLNAHDAPIYNVTYREGRTVTASGSPIWGAGNSGIATTEWTVLDRHWG